MYEEYDKAKIHELRTKAMKLPLLPGVYIMKNKSGDIIYIGKAKALKNRVSQYFTRLEAHEPKVFKMATSVNDFEYIITDSEFEALVLECSLIKQHTPKYNIKLKDDKGYSYIKITNEPWPRILETKMVEDDGAKYIGPYTSSYVVKQSVEQAIKAFKLPTCSKSFPEHIQRSKPCLYYHINQCSGICMGRVKRADYLATVKEAEQFLKGGAGKVVSELKEKMMKASERLDFEKAAELRDKIKALEGIAEKQKVMMSAIKHQDVIAMVQSGEKSAYEVFRFLDGRLCDREQFIIDTFGTREEQVHDFILRYYAMRDIPPRITTDIMPGDIEILEEYLCEKRGSKVEIKIPQIGNGQKIAEMCKNNAAENLAQFMNMRGKDTAALEDLGRLLGIATPHRIESYDISNTAGDDNVGAMVVYKDGKPYKAGYRMFKIKSFVGQDDYASMAEVLERRLQRYLDGDESFAPLPDLILLDGGKGQISAVTPIIERMGLNIPVFGMVKDSKHRTRAITSYGEEISINGNRNLFTFVSSIQEEVHRFAIGFHRKSRVKSEIHSVLTSIDGVGEKTAQKLLKKFGSVNKIKKLNLEELTESKIVNSKIAKNIYLFFNN